MATGQPGFADSMFKLASQRQTALKAEQARVTNREITRRKDIDDLSGFNASLIEGDQQRSIFESAVADVQSYIAGTGEYENAEYDPLNFKTQINKITSLYNGFIGHNQGDAAAARESLQNDAYTEGGQEIGRENGMVLMSNNTPTSYEGAVESHNNYFETAMVDGKPQFDENGHPIGYPVINGVVDRSKPPSSIFKMDAYANAENFKGESVEEQVPSLYDMSVTAQAEIQNKQNIVGPNGLQTLQEVSDLHFDNAVNDFDFLEGAIRDRNRASSNSIEITDEEMRAYAAGELDPKKKIILDDYKAKAKEEWAKLTAYGRTGSGSESPFTGNTFEHTSSFTTEADANSAGGPNVDIDGNAMELVDPAYNLANMGYGINDINITSPDHGDYTVTGIIRTVQATEEGGGRFVMIPTEEEMIRLPDGSMVPMANASEEQLNFAEAGQPGYSIVDVPNNEMIPIDGPNADPRSREILRNLTNAGIGDADFDRNQVENMGRYEELVLEREAAEETARQLQDEIDSTDVEFEENTEVGTGAPLDENDDSVSGDNAQIRTQRTTASANTGGGTGAQADRDNGSVGGLLRNLMSMGPTEAYRAYTNANNPENEKSPEQLERERLLAVEERLKAEEATREAAELAERERLLGVERELVAEGESLERIPEVRAEAVSDAMGNINEVMGKHREKTGSENLWTSPYGEIGNVAQILDPSSTNYKEELQAAIETYGYPPEGSPHKVMADVMLDQSEFGPSQYPEITERLELRAPGDVSQIAMNLVGAGREGGVDDGGIAWEEGYSPSLPINVPPSANSGVTIAGVDIGSGAAGEDGKLAMLKPYLSEQDFKALETLKGLTGAKATKALADLQEQGILTPESMNLTQGQLNEISARQTMKELKGVYKHIPEANFAKLSVEIQRAVAGLYFVGAGPNSLKRVNKAIKSGKDSDWKNAADGYMNYYGGVITPNTKDGKWWKPWNDWLKENNKTDLLNDTTSQEYKDAVVTWKLSGYGQPDNQPLLLAGNVTRAEAAAAAIYAEHSSIDAMPTRKERINK